MISRMHHQIHAGYSLRALLRWGSHWDKLPREFRNLAVRKAIDLSDTNTGADSGGGGSGHKPKQSESVFCPPPKNADP
jgi:hypothetical protein